MIKTLLRAKRIYFHLPSNNLFISSFSSFPSSFHFSFHFFFFSSFLFLFSKSPKRLLICIAKQPKSLEKRTEQIFCCILSKTTSSAERPTQMFDVSPGSFFVRNIFICGSTIHQKFLFEWGKILAGEELLNRKVKEGSHQRIVSEKELWMNKTSRNDVMVKKFRNMTVETLTLKTPF